MTFLVIVLIPVAVFFMWTIITATPYEPSYREGLEALKRIQR